MNKKTFCEECRNDVSYTIIEKELEGTIKGVKYTYLGKEARCSNCDSELYMAEINDYNLKMLYDQYRKENGIISLEIILEIPEKYAIGKRPLSLLLGWGELTFTRYCEGDVPTKQYSDILKRIYNEPAFYDEILEKNKGHLKSVASYKKSKKAVTALLNYKEEEKNKLDLAIEYLLNKCEDITPLALQKALYYTQGFYYAFYRKFIFSEECQAWIHGPVYRDIYFKYRDYKFDPIKKKENINDSVFSLSEIEILNSVAENVCCYSGKVLEKFTHLEEPWLSARGELSDNVSSERIIAKQRIGDYFSSVKTKYGMKTPMDIKLYTQAIFQQI